MRPDTQNHQLLSKLGRWWRVHRGGHTAVGVLTPSPAARRGRLHADYREPVPIVFTPVARVVARRPRAVSTRIDRIAIAPRVEVLRPSATGAVNAAPERRPGGTAAGGRSIGPAHRRLTRELKTQLIWMWVCAYASPHIQIN